MYCLRLTSQFINHNLKKMSVFIQKNNPVTGKTEWDLESDDYDFHQEVARAAYADMLHDFSRNQLYYAGLRAAITAKHSAGEKAHVLDIGTGTGLLSMMAAKCGADTIVACEAFAPMAKCARQVIQLNGMADKITVIGKRSTELKVGQDMPHKANILVTEVFDTELIGEAAISTFSHAHQHLLEVGSLVVPSSSTIYAQLVECDLMKKWQRLTPFKDEQGSTLLNIPPAMNTCPGTCVVHDLQLSALDTSEFKPLSDAIPVLEFDWSNPNIPVKRDVKNIIIPHNSGKCYGILFWWDLKMDRKGEIILSCAPKWYKHSKYYWRDHWIQAIYYFPREIDVVKDQELVLHTCHDEYSFWFYTNENLPRNVNKLEIPNCNCGLHQSANFTRIGHLNDNDRRKKYLASLLGKVHNNTIALVTGDNTLLPLLVKKLGAKEVYTTDEAMWTRDIATHNNLDVNYIKKSEISKEMMSKLTLVCSEPYYSAAILPWYNLSFWFTRSELQLGKDVTVMPCEASVWAIPVQLEDLWKIRATLGDVEGFKMTPFDELIEKSSEISDSKVEPQPLWEYPNTCLGESTSLVKFDLTQGVCDNITTNGVLPISSAGQCHAICLWVDWQLDANTVVSTGPTTSPTPGQYITWDKHSRQGVYLIRPYTKVNVENVVKYHLTFDVSSGNINFEFNIDVKGVD